MGKPVFTKLDIPRFGTKGINILRALHSDLLYAGYTYKGCSRYAHAIVHRYVNSNAEVAGINEFYNSGNHVCTINLETRRTAL